MRADAAQSGPSETGAAAIDAYLDQLAGELHIGTSDTEGRHLLDEAGDHLHCHAEDLISRGVPARAATATALTAFGTVKDNVARMRTELLRPHLRRLSASMLGLGLVLGLSWTSLFELAPPAPWNSANRPPLSRAFEWGAETLAAAALLQATVALALIVIPGRAKLLARWWAVAQRWSARALVGSLICGTAAGIQTLGYLVIRTARDALSLSWPAVTLATVMTVAGAFVIARPLLAIAGRYVTAAQLMSVVQTTSTLTQQAWAMRDVDQLIPGN